VIGDENIDFKVGSGLAVMFGGNTLLGSLPRGKNCKTPRSHAQNSELSMEIRQQVALLVIGKSSNTFPRYNHCGFETQVSTYVIG